MLKVPLVLVLLAAALVCAAPAAAQTPEAPPPSAAFTAEPSAPLTFQAITLTATYQNANPNQYRWDLDGDQRYDDGSGRRIRTQYQTPGPRTVGLRLNGVNGAPLVSTQVITVLNRPPRILAIRATPGSSTVDESVTFTGQAEDRDGTVVSWDWELDGDRDFDDATGQTASRRFYSAGRYRIGLRVRDNSGAPDIQWVWFTVAPPPSPTQPPAGPPKPPAALPPASPPPSSAPRPVYRVPPLMSPFPFVRVAGYLQRDGARLTLVLIRGPRGANVRIRCSHSRRCPYRTRRARIGRSRRIRVRSLQRFLPAGLRLELSVTQPNRIGKRVTYRIRRGRLPVRWDGCIVPGWKRAMRCS